MCTAGQIEHMMVAIEKFTPLEKYYTDVVRFSQEYVPEKCCYEWIVDHLKALKLKNSNTLKACNLGSN